MLTLRWLPTLLAAFVLVGCGVSLDTFRSAQDTARTYLEAVRTNDLETQRRNAAPLALGSCDGLVNFDSSSLNELLHSAMPLVGYEILDAAEREKLAIVTARLTRRAPLFSATVNSAVVLARTEDGWRIRGIVPVERSAVQLLEDFVASAAQCRR